jgi:cobalt-zinc-cadmium resistance protein CzcA
LEQTRSLSRYGLSQITVVFKDGTDIYFARQLINERIQEARNRIPAGISPELGPIATGLGEIYLWTVEAKPEAKKPDGTPYTTTDLREIQDWIIKPQLRNVPGVTEINSIGGYAKEYHIAPSPEKLTAYHVSLQDLVTALERNNGNVGAGYIERRGEQYLIRAPGQVRSLDDIRNIILGNVRGVPIRIADVATVDIGRELRNGAATDNGREVVLGTVIMLMGQNSRAVSMAVDQKMKQINQNLPAGVEAITVYNRTTLVDKAIHTVKKNLLEGAVLVVVILFLFLGNMRAAIITAMVIPLAMLFTFTGMVSNQVSANLLSLGALDFGIIIDGAVVIVENCVRRLAHAQAHHGRPLSRSERFHEIFAASKEARRPLIFGQLIIMVVYLPIFALSGIEGKMFHPMALTVVIALAGAMILSITFVPAAVALFIGNEVREKQNGLMRVARKVYEPLLARGMANKPVVLTLVGAVVLLSGLIGSRMGSEFIPSLNEGDFAIQALRIPGTSLTQSLEMQKQLETTLKKKFPEIERVFASTGTSDVASDPMPPSISDGYIMLKPEDQWPKPRKTRDELLRAVQEAVDEIPGNNYEFSQPIQLRFNELISGVRSDVAIKIFGDDMDILNTNANRIAAVLEKVPGATGVKVEQTTGLSTLTVNIDRDKSARYGLNIADVQEEISTATGGKAAGTMFEGDRRFDIVVRLPEALRSDPNVLKRLPIQLPANGQATASYIPLGEIASFDLAPGPNQISREDGKRRVVVSVNVKGRDLGSFVADAETQIDKAVKVPTGYWITWGGQYENLASAAGIPFALTGGIVALWLRGIPMSISAAVGFIALCGVAVLNGLVMISFIRNLREEGRSLDDAIHEGAMTRLRPVLMTALVASLGFIPMALATGTGAEVQRPLATVVIGGILSSTALTLLVLPLLYQLAHRRDKDADAGIETQSLASWSKYLPWKRT